MFEKKLLAGMHHFNRFIHILLALALGISCAMVVWDVAVNIYQAWIEGNASQAFLHALGSLFILWTLATLISAEISYIETGRISARVFVVVVMISIIRELIIQPIQAMSGGNAAAVSFDPLKYGLLIAGLLVTGLVYWLVSHAARGKGSSDITLDA